MPLPASDDLLFPAALWQPRPRSGGPEEPLPITRRDELGIETAAASADGPPPGPGPAFGEGPPGHLAGRRHGAGALPARCTRGDGGGAAGQRLVAAGAAGGLRSAADGERLVGGHLRGPRGLARHLRVCRARGGRRPALVGVGAQGSRRPRGLGPVQSAAPSGGARRRAARGDLRAGRRTVHPGPGEGRRALPSPAHPGDARGRAGHPVVGLTARRSGLRGLGSLRAPPPADRHGRPAARRPAGHTRPAAPRSGGRDPAAAGRGVRRVRAVPQRGAGGARRSRALDRRAAGAATAGGGPPATAPETCR